jgi:hypothetical protein
MIHFTKLRKRNYITDTNISHELTIGPIQNLLKLGCNIFNLWVIRCYAITNQTCTKSFYGSRDFLPLLIYELLGLIFASD